MTMQRICIVLATAAAIVAEPQGFGGPPPGYYGPTFTCPSANVILPPEAVCNGVPDCPGGEDESACGYGYPDYGNAYPDYGAPPFAAPQPAAPSAPTAAAEASSASAPATAPPGFVKLPDELQQRRYGSAPNGGDGTSAFYNSGKKLVIIGKRFFSDCSDQTNQSVVAHCAESQPLRYPLRGREKSGDGGRPAAAGRRPHAERQKRGEQTRLVDSRFYAARMRPRRRHNGSLSDASCRANPDFLTFSSRLPTALDAARMPSALDSLAAATDAAATSATSATSVADEPLVFRALRRLLPASHGGHVPRPSSRRAVLRLIRRVHGGVPFWSMSSARC